MVLSNIVTFVGHSRCGIWEIRVTMVIAIYCYIKMEVNSSDMSICVLQFHLLRVSASIAYSCIYLVPLPYFGVSNLDSCYFVLHSP